MPVSNLFPRRWRIKVLLFWQLIAFAWLAGFLLPAGKPVWQALDSGVFFTLNAWLDNTSGWITFWAWANVRAADLVAALAIWVSLSFPRLGFRRDQLQQALVGFVLILVVMLPLRELLNDWTLAQGLSGRSPSLVLSPANRLSELAPHIPAKDGTSNSFPGDHGTIVLCWLGLFILSSRRPLAIGAVALLSVLFMLPRLVAGAHWLSDNLVGSLSITILTLSWCYCTPLLQWLTDKSLRVLEPIIRFGRRIPLVGSMAFFMDSQNKR